MGLGLETRVEKIFDGPNGLQQDFKKIIVFYFNTKKNLINFSEKDELKKS